MNTPKNFPNYRGVKTRMLALLLGSLPLGAHAALTSVSQLATTAGSPGQTQIVLGYDTPGDGGGGVFIKQQTASGPVNGGTIFNSPGSGKWVRQFSGPLQAAWFGVKPVRDRRCAVRVNGVDIGYVAFPSTGAWTTWEKEAIDIPLNAGANTIRITCRDQDGGPNLDALSLGTIVYQGENYTSQSGSATASTNSGYTGSGYADMGGAGTYLQWSNINVPTAGTYALTLTYANADDAGATAVAQNTTRLQAALNAAAGGVLQIGHGEYQVSNTLIIPANTRFEGRVARHGSIAGRGTLLQAYGAGVSKKWQDTGNSALDSFRPVLVFGGNNVVLAQMSVDGWDVGILLPTVQGCTIDNCDLSGVFPVAACLMDGTWSPQNTAMINLHGGKVQPASGLLNNAIDTCLIKGVNGLMIRGAVARNPASYSASGWIWAPQGISNLKITASRLGASGGGTVFSYDLPVKDAQGSAKATQLISCNLRVGSSGNMVDLDHAWALVLEGCYLEGSNNSALTNSAQNSGTVQFLYTKTVDVSFSGWDYSKTTTK